METAEELAEKLRRAVRFRYMTVDRFSVKLWRTRKPHFSREGGFWVGDSYSSGWTGIGDLPDPPVKGIDELFRKLRNAGMVIVIYSCRAYELAGYKAIISWLTRWKLIGYVERVVYTKPIAFCYVDDRALQFRGDSQEMFWKIMNFRSWTEEAGDEGSKV